MAKAMLVGSYPRERRINEMEAGEVGYTVPWAYAPETEELNDAFTISEKGGTACMRVSCTMPGVYSVRVEDRVYRTPGVRQISLFERFRNWLCK